MPPDDWSSNRKHTLTKLVLVVPFEDQFCIFSALGIFEKQKCAYLPYKLVIFFLVPIMCRPMLYAFI